MYSLDIVDMCTIPLNLFVSRFILCTHSMKIFVDIHSLFFRKYFAIIGIHCIAHSIAHHVLKIRTRGVKNSISLWVRILPIEALLFHYHLFYRSKLWGSKVFHIIFLSIYFEGIWNNFFENLRFDRYQRHFFNCFQNGDKMLIHWCVKLSTNNSWFF